MKFFFVRHGETDFNAQKRIMGQLDHPLNEKGIRQVNDLLPELEKIEFQLIFSSTLARARETARVIAEHFHLPVEFRDELRERNFGSLAGKTWDEIGALTGRDMNGLDVKQQYDYRAYGGESTDDIQRRVMQFIGDVKTRYPEKTVLVVTHGGVLRLLHNFFRNEEIEKIGNTSIHEFEL